MSHTDITINPGQPLPTRNTLPSIWEDIIADMRSRDAKGIETYGTPLQPLNGRNPLRDLDEELLDALAYNRQFREELVFLRRELGNVYYTLKANGPQGIESAVLDLEEIFSKYQFLK